MPTVQEFSDELKLSVDELLDMLWRSASAERRKANAEDVARLTPKSPLSGNDKARLLEYLRMREEKRKRDERLAKANPPAIADKPAYPTAKPEKTVFDQSVSMTTRRASKLAKGSR